MVVQLGKKVKKNRAWHLIFLRRICPMSPPNDALLTTIEINEFKTLRMSVDRWISIDILLWDTFECMGYKKEVKSVYFLVIGFIRSTFYSLGNITLPMVLGKGWKNWMINVLFIVVNPPPSYNAFLCRTTINPNNIIPSKVHRKMKLQLLTGCQKF